MLAALFAASLALAPQITPETRERLKERLSPEAFARFERSLSPECRGPVVQHASRSSAAEPQTLGRMPRGRYEKAVVRVLDGCMVPVLVRNAEAAR